MRPLFPPLVALSVARKRLLSPNPLSQNVCCVFWFCRLANDLPDLIPPPSPSHQLARIIAHHLRKLHSTASTLMSQHNYSPVVIDGGLLEGGGQILRIAISLGGLLRRPIQVVNIRGNRPKPGLMAQHLTGLRLASEITGGQLSGDSIGSMEIRFKPGKAAGNAGQYFADTGTAGSVTLLLQANLPILVFGAAHPCSLRLRGGTNVGMAPQVDFTSVLLRPLLERFGICFNIDVTTRGYYPKGGGEIVATVIPRSEPTPPIDLTNRGDILQIDGYSFVGGKLSPSVAQEMATEARMLLKERYPNIPITITPVVEQRVGNNGTGNGIVLIASTAGGCKLSGNGLGSRDLPPAAVGRRAAEELLRELEHGAAVDSYTQDQLIIFMALASGRSRLLSGPITMHTQTAIYVIEQMIPQVKFTISPVEASPNLKLIEVDGISFTSRGNSSL